MNKMEIIISDLEDISLTLCEYGDDSYCESIQKAIALLTEQEERIKLLENQLETITKWRMNAGAFD